MGLLDYPMIWTIDSLAAFLDVPQVGGFTGATPITRFITSAKLSQTGDVCVATAVSEQECYNFSKRAIENGAVCILTSNQNLKGDFPILHVPRAGGALLKLAKFARERFEGKVLGITGSVGKTTTKDMLALCLGFSGSTHSTTANLNATPANRATVASIPRKAHYSVIELSLMGPDVVRRKSLLAKPHVSIITGIGYSHAAHHGDDGRDAILVGKTEIFKGMKKGGIAVLPSGDKKFDAMIGIAQNSPGVARIISCGQRDEDTVRLVRYDLHPTYSEVVINVEGKEYCYIISQPGRHFVMNSLLVAGGLLAVGADLHVLGGLSAYAPTERRVERFRVTLAGDRTIELIDDAYNAAPDSVRALLDILKLRNSTKRKVLVLGNMLELGPDEMQHHAELVPDIEAAGIDLLVTVGDLACQVGENVKGMDVLAFETSAQAAKKIPDLLHHLDLVSVKGSNSMELIRVVNALKGLKTKPERQNMNWSIEQED